MHNRLLLLLVFLLNALALRAQVITPGAATGTIIGCIGTASTSPNLQKIVVTGTALSSTIAVTAPANFEVSLTESGSYTTLATLPKAGGTIYVRSAAIAPIGNLSGNVSFSCPGAATVTTQVFATVKALPVVNLVQNQTVNSGDAITPVNFAGSGLYYKWINDNPAIGIAASGSGDIPAFTAVNNTTSPITATFTVTPQPPGYIYTANFDDNSVSAISAATIPTVTTIPVGTHPSVTIVSAGQSKVYVACEGEIYVVNTYDNTVMAKVKTGASPRFLLLSKDNSKLYILVNDGPNPGRLVVMDVATNTIIGSVTTGPTLMFAVNGIDGNHVYAASYGISGGGPLYDINVSTLSIDNTYALSNYPQGLLISPDGKYIYISDVGGDVVTSFNLLTKEIVKTPVGNHAQGMVMSKDGSIIYEHNMLSNDVSVISTVTNRVVATIPTGEYSVGIALSPDGKWLYITARVSKEVTVISTETNSPIAHIPLDGPGIFNPVLSPDGTTLYAVDNYPGTLHIINTATNTLIKDMPIRGPSYINNESVAAGTGCNGQPITFTITVNPQVPKIISTGRPNAVNTTFGAPSASASFAASGSDLKESITITLPVGFEISTNNIAFANSLTVGGANMTDPVTIYIRLASITNAGTYNGNIVLSSPGAASVSVLMPNSSVRPADLDIYGTMNKVYGETLTSFTLDESNPDFHYTPAGLRNGNTFKSVKINIQRGNRATDPAGTYADAAVFSDFEGGNGFLAGNYNITYYPFDIVTHPAPVTIKAGNVSKPFGTELPVEPASTNFTVAGLVNNETIAKVILSYGAGAAGTDAPGIYAGSVIPSNASGGTFLAGNYTITYLPGDLSIDPPSPAVFYTSAPANLRAVYGDPTTSTFFVVSGTNLLAYMAITPAEQFEVSTDNITFYSGVGISSGNLGKLTDVKIYVRMKRNLPAGTYATPIMLESRGAIDVAIPITGIITPAPLSINVQPASKTYGTTLTANSVPALFTATGLKNGDVVSSVRISYGAGSEPTASVGNYNAAIIPFETAGPNFNSNNYTISYNPSSITVTPAPLIIKAVDMSRAFATANPTFEATYTGFVNNDGPASLSVLPLLSTPARFTSPAGQYPITVGGAVSANYNISYQQGTLSIYGSSQKINVPNTFTPNNDGVNDLWVITGLQYYPLCTVDIFNRYGSPLYHSKGYGQPWNGMYKNQPLPAGTYYYIISPNDGIQTSLSGYIPILK